MKIRKHLLQCIMCRISGISRKGKVQSVEKWRMTIHRLFSKDPNDEEENVTQNIYVFRFILFCIIVYSFEMLLNSVDIFIVDKTIFTRGYVTGCLFAAVYVLILLHSRYVHVKATVHIYVCTYSAFHYYQYLCRILLWCVRCQYGASDNYFYESSG